MIRSTVPLDSGVPPANQTRKRPGLSVIVWHRPCRTFNRLAISNRPHNPKLGGSNPPPRNQNFFPFSKFCQPCNHPN
jgi:hypothetical protein